MLEKELLSFVIGIVWIYSILHFSVLAINEVYKRLLELHRDLMEWKEEKVAQWYSFLEWKDRMIRNFSRYQQRVTRLVTTTELQTPRINTPVQNINTHNIPENMRCIICAVNERKIIMMPCGHFDMCQACSYNVSDCPVCRKRIRHRQLVYMS